MGISRSRVLNSVLPASVTFMVSLTVVTIVGEEEDDDLHPDDEPDIPAEVTWGPVRSSGRRYRPS